ncbi:DgyrCDS6799 [Dimorphilus gyrociliatus]|uniref:DgyrCDS6799 n=1 Tax=Dimorphilus gyrociliatus TaxID=2664684 RepID=A0A7I8VP41_9ANNE|nr:DgyrCDS6799 [Dimorphilus gyrociliatus]
MAFMMRLEDLAFYNAVKLFGSFKKESSFIDFIKEKNIPTLMYDRLFNSLYKHFIGVQGDILKMFVVENFPLSNIRFGDARLKCDESIEFLKDHKLQHLRIEQLTSMTVESLLEFIDVEKLQTLSISNCAFLPEKLLVTKLAKRKREQREQKETKKFEYLRKFPCLRNLTSLNLSNTELNDLQLFFITKEVNLLVEVNIAKTNVTDIRLLKKQTNLESLDCSELKESVGRTLVHLHCFEKLRFLRFGNSTPSQRIGWSYNVNPFIRKYLNQEEFLAYRKVPQRFKTKLNWSMSEFLRLADWTDLTFFDLHGKWRISQKSLKEFITTHTKLRFIRFFKDFSQILRTILPSDKIVEDLLDIRHYEKFYGRSEFSLKALHSSYKFPVQPILLNADIGIAYWYDSQIFHEQYAIPGISLYKVNFPKEKSLELCEIANINYIYSKLFAHLTSDYSGSDHFTFIKAMSKFLQEIDLDNLPKQELYCIFKGLRNTESWIHLEEFDVLIEDLYGILLNFHAFCKEKFDWDMVRAVTYVKRIYDWNVTGCQRTSCTFDSDLDEEKSNSSGDLEIFEPNENNSLLEDFPSPAIFGDTAGQSECSFEMPIVLRLEDLVFFHIIRNFTTFKEQEFFLQLFKQGKVPPVTCDKLFNGLNRFYGGIPDEILKIFTKENFKLRNITLDDSNIFNKLTSTFLTGHKLQSLTIERLAIWTVEDVIDLIDSDELKTLSCHRATFLPENKIYKKVLKRKRKQETQNFTFIRQSPRLINVTSLYVSKTKMNNVQLFFVTKEMFLIENLDIADTRITDLRLLKKQSNLQYLDCSGLKEFAGKHYIHLHCLKKLKHLRFGNTETRLTMLRLGWSSIINPVIRQNLNEEEFKAFSSVPEQFRSRSTWHMSEFLELANWKDLRFFDLIGKWKSSPKSISEFIRNHKKLKYFGFSKNFTDDLSAHMEITKEVKNLFDIKFYEKSYGRDNMSFKVYHKKISFPVDIVDLPVDTYVSDVEETFSNEIIPSLNRYKENFPKENHSEFCKLLLDELKFKSMNFRNTACDIGEICLRALSMDIEKSDHFLPIIQLLAHILSYRHSYPNSPLDFIFMEMLTKYFRYFKIAINLPGIFKKIFIVPRESDLHSYYMSMEKILAFLENINLEDMSQSELSALCLGTKQIKSWHNGVECEELAKKLYETIMKIINYCTKKFGWDLSKSKTYLKPLTKKFAQGCTGVYSYYSGEEDQSNDEFRCFYDTSTDNDDCSPADYQDFDDGKVETEEVSDKVRYQRLSTDSKAYKFYG